MERRLIIKSILLSVALCLLSGITILVSVLYVRTFSDGFIYENKPFLISTVTIVVSIITTIALAYTTSDKKTIYKISLVVLSLITLSLLIMYFLKISGIGDKIDSVEDLRNYVASFGYLAVIIFVSVNVFQVLLLPIPGVISIGTGVALFGPFRTSIYSLLGVLIGSFAAFFIGRVLGYKVVAWIVGQENLDKWLKKVKNKDKIILTFMFLFPFFPDDMLCFIAGLSSMSVGYFIVMIIFCRTISVFVSSYSLNGSIIPFNTWWGILLWALVIAVTVLVTIIIYKRGDKIQSYFRKRLKLRRKKFESNTARRP